MKKQVINVEFADLKNERQKNSRRKFLKNSGLLVAGTGLFLYSCSPEEEGFDGLVLDAKANAPDKRAGKVFNLGKGDLAILNYAYILEQLEAAFYTQLIESNTFAATFPDEEEKELFIDLYAHEVIHRDFFKMALTSVAPPGKIAPTLEFNFSSVDFSDRKNVLKVSQILEDTGVAAYNGAGNLLENPEYLLVAGKIVSVEARHASAIRDIIGDDTGDDTNFASDDVLVELLGTGPAYDKALDPEVILQAVANTGYLETKLITNNIPTE